MEWLSLALSSAAFLGLYEVARKASLRENAVLVVLLVANIGGLGALLAALGLAECFSAHVQTTGHPSALTSLRVEPLTLPEHAAVFLKACIVTASWVLSYWAVKHLPLSIASPLRSLSPIVTIVGALIIFQESPRPLQWVGMSILLLGYLGFAWLGPQEGITFTANRWVWLLLLGTAVGAISGLYDKYLLQGLELAPTTLQCWFSVYNVLLQALLVWFLWWRRPHRTPFRFKPILPCVGVLLVVADQFYFRAMAMDGALVSVISLVRRSSVVLSFILGGYLFREQLLMKKSGFLAVLALGLIVLFL